MERPDAVSVFGVDFTSAPCQRKPLTVASAIVATPYMNFSTVAAIVAMTLAVAALSPAAAAQTSLEGAGG